jgi:hypothetical protein
MNDTIDSIGTIAESSRVSRRTVQAAIGLTTVYVAFSTFLPLARFNVHHVPLLYQIALIFVPTLVFMLLQLALALSIVRLRLPPSRSLALAAAMLFAWIGTLYFHPSFHTMSVKELIFFLVLKPAVMGVTLTVSLTCFGSLLSLIIKEPNLLLPVALIAMPIDYVGAMTSIGFTHDMVKHMPNLVSNLSVAVPKITTISGHGVSLGPIAFIGPGDVLFMALFFTSVQRFKLAERATFWWMYGLLTLAMLLVIFLPNFPVGALVPMGLAVIIANASRFRLKRDEVFAVAYAGAMILAIVGLFFWSSHHKLFHSH